MISFNKYSYIIYKIKPVFRNIYTCYGWISVCSNDTNN